MMNQPRAHALPDLLKGYTPHEGVSDELLTRVARCALSGKVS
jgi:hypothetical protein